MAQFYGTVKGKAKTVASRLGHKTTGLKVSANGWDSGVEVELEYDKEKNIDVINLYVTGGSNNPRVKRYEKLTIDEKGNLIHLN